MTIEIKRTCDMFGEIYKVCITKKRPSGRSYIEILEYFVCEKHAQRIANKVGGHVYPVKVRVPTPFDQTPGGG